MSKIEIERKYLVTGDTWKPADRSVPCRQGYLLHGPPLSVRVRTMGQQAYLTIKQDTGDNSAGGGPAQRVEYEYPVPLTDATSMLETICDGCVVEKTRHYKTIDGHTWEIDVFEGRNAGLVVAEIELDDATLPIDVPDWAGPEVTADPRYLNARLSRAPYDTWPQS